MIKPATNEHGRFEAGWRQVFAFIRPAARFSIASIIIAYSLVAATMGAAKDVPASAVQRVVSLQIQVQSESVTNQQLHLRGSDARQQLLVSARHESGILSDVTRKVTYEISPPSLATIDATGIVSPLADGKGTLGVKTEDGITSTIPLIVE